MANVTMRDVMKKSDFVLIGICVLLAAGFLLLAGKNAAEAGNFLTIDSLFFTAVCLLLALTFVAVPALVAGGQFKLKMIEEKIDGLFFGFPDSFRANGLRTTRPTGAATEAPAHEESH